MGFTLPFTRDLVVAELVGRVAISLNPRTDVGLELWEDVDLCPDGTLNGGKDVVSWRVRGGILELCDTSGMTVYWMNGIETENGGVYLTGRSNHHAHPKYRVIMHKVARMGDNFQVAISTHVSYVDKTAMRLVRSLEREGISRSRIVLVVGGAKEAVIRDREGMTECLVKGNYMGFTGLEPFVSGAMIPKTSHILLLHDTCEAIAGFGEMAKSVDVGLPFDSIFLLPKAMKVEMGFWATSFIERLNVCCPKIISSSVPMLLFDRLGLMSNLSSCVNGRWNKGFRELKSRDVYGLGTQRSVLESESAHLKKYRSVAGASKP
jgi:hypothetical protein